MNIDERQRLIDLIIKSWSNELSAEEAQEYNALQNDSYWNQLIEDLRNDDYLIKRFREYEHYLSVADYSEFLLQIKHPVNKKNLRRVGLWVSCAACLAILLGLSFFFYRSPSYTPDNIHKTRQLKNNHPDVAKLLIDDNKEITLSPQVVSQLDTLGIKLQNQINVLSYAHLSDSLYTTIEYHTLIIPKGNIYRLILSDSSRVILNADSKITYPASFVRGKERHVKIEGEAYFEINRDTASPFIVEGRNFKVNVLGTVFNVNSYDNESTSNITLVSGSIQMETPDTTVKLKPQEMFILNRNNAYEIKNVDWKMVVSWIHHKFCFNYSNVEEIMRKISRWYGVDIVYDTSVIDGHFTGIVPADFKLEELLELLSSTTDITFSIRNGVVYVK